MKLQVIWANAHETHDNYSSSCSQVVLVCLQLFRQNSLLKCASQQKIKEEISKIPHLLGGGSRSFKDINVDAPQKPVDNSCYG